MAQIREIRGRFAPTPSGSLHFGSLIAAIGSYLNSKSHNGKWFVRIDDLDTARTVPGAITNILKTLDLFGLHWDDDILFQSHRIPAYNEAIDQLSTENLIYPCSCSRKIIGDNPYPGTCRNKLSENRSNLSLRVKTENNFLKFHDLKQGLFKQNIEKEIGDFVVKRADGFIAYHLATVVDDQFLNITEVVRGADLLDSTPRQIYIQNLLDYTPTKFLHLPIAVDQKGQKLSKTNGALAIDQDQLTPSILIFKALDFLGQLPPKELQQENVSSCIQWGIENWNIENIPNKHSIFMDLSDQKQS